MNKLASWNVTALCVTNRVQFVPNILRQWDNTAAGNLVVVIDYCQDTQHIVGAFKNKRVQQIAKIDYQPKVTEVGDIPVIEWDRVKLVVVLKHTTLGGCRNLALRFADTPYVTWMDDDDLQLRHRVPSLILYTKKHQDYYGSCEQMSLLVKGGLPLLDAKTGLVKVRKKAFSWLEGIYYRPHIKPFPGISMSEDYHWMQQFDSAPHKELSYPRPLAVHIKHEANTSDVRKLSMNTDFWRGNLSTLDPWWSEAFQQWQIDLGLGMFLEGYADLLSAR